MSVPYTITLPTLYGQMLVNRFDINQTTALVKSGAACDRRKVEFAVHACSHARPGAVMLDVGANFGIFSLACAAVLAPLGGRVHAFEGQRMLSYMIGGSAALNGVENLFVHHVCVGDSREPVAIPKFDYSQPMNFGSIEFGATQIEPLHQVRGQSTEVVSQMRLDDSDFGDVCFLKIDVEGMEENVLAGARLLVERSRPMALVEYLKSDKLGLARIFERLDYAVYDYDGDLLCMPREGRLPGLNIDLPALA